MRLHLLIRWAAGLMAMVMTASLIRLGETSMAVGLIPSPWDKLAHASTFGVIALLLWLAAGRRWLLACAGLALVLACYDEWRQLMLPGREADIYDLLADTVGIAAVIWFATRLISKEG